ncbi:MAG: IPExxxVDY family protein [Bacteroidales bacterium]|nr:IPExxxVDY family protein [Bacteroidales bacterium]
MVKKKNKIVVEPFDDIRIIGINSHLEDYKLAWHINNVLKINLIKYSDIINEDGQPFSFYLYDGGENSNAFNLVGLVNEEAKWIKLPLPTDYLIVIRNFITEDSYQAITSKIKQIPGVILVYNVDVEKTRKIDNLLEDIEIHEIELVKVRD